MKTAKVKAVVTPGIYLLEDGSYRAVARVGTKSHGSERRKEHRFSQGASLRLMKRWLEDTRAELRRQNIRPVLGTLAAEIERYLEKPEVRKLASYKTRLSDTRAWNERFGNLRRDELSSEALQTQIDDWLHSGIGAWTVRHRINALRQVYIVLDGVDSFNPTRKVKSPSKPRAIPHALDYDTIATTLNQMAPSTTKGFLLIMAFCGFRPCEIRRTEPWMLKLDANPPHVIRNTAKGGDVVTVPLSKAGVLAWRMFTTRGGFDKDERVLDKGGRPRRTRTFPNANRDWKEAMRRAGFAPTRCYDLVHSYCTKLLHEGGGDITLVQKARGHRDIRTTLVYTQVTVDPRLAACVVRAFDKTAEEKS